MIEIIVGKPLDELPNIEQAADYWFPGETHVFYSGEPGDLKQKIVKSRQKRKRHE